MMSDFEISLSRAFIRDIDFYFCFKRFSCKDGLQVSISLFLHLSFSVAPSSFTYIFLMLRLFSIATYSSYFQMSDMRNTVSYISLNENTNVKFIHKKWGDIEQLHIIYTIYFRIMQFPVAIKGLLLENDHSIE